MAKYHVNNNGETGVCHAKKSCPFGDLVSDHFDSPGEARSAYEAKMKNITLRSKNKAMTKNYQTTPKLSTIMDIDKLNNLVRDRYVTVTSHPEDESLKVLTYSKSTQYEGKWNDVTTQARGLIIKSNRNDFSDAVIIERPWRKFFTLQQISSADGETKAWELGDDEDGVGDNSNIIDMIDFDAPAEVTDKMDGSLGILYRAPDGKLALATKGSFQSDQAKYYTRMLRKDPEMYGKALRLVQENPDKSFMFEMTGINNQIVVEYDSDELSLLGAVNRENGHYYSPNDYAKTWDKITETMPAKNLNEALSLPDRPNREGVVVRMISDDPEKQFQIKIKQEDYVKLHRMMTGLSKKTAREVVRNANINAHDLISVAESKNVEDIKEIRDILKPIKDGNSQFHSILYSKHRETFEQAIIPKAEQLKRFSDDIAALPQSDFEGRDAMGNFARKVQSINDSFEKAQKLSMFKNRLYGDDILNINIRKILSNISRDMKDDTPGNIE